MAMSAKERVRKSRNRKRAAGMKKLEIWVPDVSAPGFAEEAHRQSLLADHSDDEREVMDWAEQMRAEVWADIDAREQP